MNKDDKIKQAQKILNLFDDEMLFNFAKNGFENPEQFFIDKDADINKTNNNGQTLLHIASEYGYKIIAKKLIALDADINRKEHSGKTPLVIAAINNHANIVEMLLDAGAKACLNEEAQET